MGRWHWSQPDANRRVAICTHIQASMSNTRNFQDPRKNISFCIEFENSFPCIFLPHPKPSENISGVLHSRLKPTTSRWQNVGPSNYYCYSFFWMATTSCSNLERTARNCILKFHHQNGYAYYRDQQSRLSLAENCNDDLHLLTWDTASRNHVHNHCSYFKKF